MIPMQDRVESTEAVFVPLSPDRLDLVIKSFLEDHLAVTPTYQFDCLPPPFSIDLDHCTNLTMRDKLRLFASLRCSNFPFAELFSSDEPSDCFFEGMTLAVNSWNPEAVVRHLCSSPHSQYRQKILSSLRLIFF